MFKTPDDPITHEQVKGIEDRIQNNVQWDDGAVINIISYFPADASGIREYARTFSDHLLLKLYIVLQLLLYSLAAVVSSRIPCQYYTAGK